jgi:hypothetical protein
MKIILTHLISLTYLAYRYNRRMDSEWTVEDKNTLVLKRVNPLEIDTDTNRK